MAAGREKLVADAVDVLTRRAVEVASEAASGRRGYPFTPVGVVPVSSVVPVASTPGAGRTGISAAPPRWWAGRSPRSARWRGPASPVITRVGIVPPVRIATPSLPVGRAGRCSPVVGAAVVPRSFASAATSSTPATRGSLVTVIGSDLALVDTRGGVVRLMRGGKVDTDAAAVQILAVERFNRCGGAFDVAHGDEAKPTRSARARIVNDHHLVDGRDGIEFVLEIRLNRADGETEYTEHRSRLDMGRSIARLGRGSAATIGARRRWGSTTVVSSIPVVPVITARSGGSGTTTREWRTAAAAASAVVAKRGAITSSRDGGGRGRARIRSASRRRRPGPAVFVHILVVRNGATFHRDVHAVVVRVHVRAWMGKRNEVHAQLVIR